MALDSGSRPTLVLNPPDDEDFRAFAEALVAHGIAEAPLLQDCVRERYPSAIVRPRDLAGEHAQIWYVYRDGHWVRPGRRTGRPLGTFTQEEGHPDERPDERPVLGRSGCRPDRGRHRARQDRAGPQGDG